MIYSAGFLIVDKDNCEVLLIKNKAGHWDFPKGHVEAGENLEEAALRELVEETGISPKEIQPQQKQFKLEYYVRVGKKIDKKQVTLTLAFMKKRDISLSHEHSAYAWVPLDKIDQYIKYKEQKMILNELRNYLC